MSREPKRALKGVLKTPFTLSLSKGRSWFDKLTTNGSGDLLDTLSAPDGALGLRSLTQTSSTRSRPRLRRSTRLRRLPPE